MPVSITLHSITWIIPDVTMDAFSFAFCILSVFVIGVMSTITILLFKDIGMARNHLTEKPRKAPGDEKPSDDTLGTEKGIVSDVSGRN